MLHARRVQKATSSWLGNWRSSLDSTPACRIARGRNGKSENAITSCIAGRVRQLAFVQNSKILRITSPLQQRFSILHLEEEMLD